MMELHTLSLISDSRAASQSDCQTVRGSQDASLTIHIFSFKVKKLSISDSRTPLIVSIIYNTLISLYILRFTMFAFE